MPHPISHRSPCPPPVSAITVNPAPPNSHNLVKNQARTALEATIDLPSPRALSPKQMASDRKQFERTLIGSDRPEPASTSGEQTPPLAQAPVRLTESGHSRCHPAKPTVEGNPAFVANPDLVAIFDTVLKADRLSRPLRAWREALVGHLQSTPFVANKSFIEDLMTRVMAVATRHKNRLLSSSYKTADSHGKEFDAIASYLFEEIEKQERNGTIPALNKHATPEQIHDRMDILRSLLKVVTSSRRGLHMKKWSSQVETALALQPALNVPVPRQSFNFWFGGAPGDEELNNLRVFLTLHPDYKHTIFAGDPVAMERALIEFEESHGIDGMVNAYDEQGSSKIKTRMRNRVKIEHINAIDMPAKAAAIVARESHGAYANYPAAKDIASYAALMGNGGLIMDWDIKFTSTLPPLHAPLGLSLLASEDRGLNNNILAAPAGSKLIGTLLEKAIAKYDDPENSEMSWQSKRVPPDFSRITTEDPYQRYIQQENTEMLSDRRVVTMAWTGPTLLRELAEENYGIYFFNVGEQLCKLGSLEENDHVFSGKSDGDWILNLAKSARRNSM